MGGKNAIIVDDDADLDEAVLGVVQERVRLPGAEVLGLLAGRSCWPASTTRFSQRLVEATRSLKIGPAEDPATSVGPVIDEEAFARIQRYIEIGKQRRRDWCLAVDVGHAGRGGLLRRPAHLRRRAARRPGWPRRRSSAPCWR